MVHSGSFWLALGVDRFIGVGWVNFGAPWEWSGSFAFVGFIHAGSDGRRVHVDSSGSLGCALGVVGFIRFHWVHSDVFWAWSGSFGFVGVIRTRPGGRRVHSG